VRATYEDSGSGKLTGRHLQELANQLPPEAEILSMKVEESQRDGWFWSIKAVMPELPTRPHTLKRDLGRMTGQRADHG
jgi:hypothetical protein